MFIISRKTCLGYFSNYFSFSLFFDWIQYVEPRSDANTSAAIITEERKRLFGELGEVLGLADDLSGAIMKKRLGKVREISNI